MDEYSRELDGLFPDFKLGKTESLLYLFPRVSYFERVTRRKVQGKLIDSATVTDWGGSGPEVVSASDEGLLHYASESALHA